MSSMMYYVSKLKKGILHRGETAALEGGVSFGPGRDPKGSFYSSPRVTVYWNQPDSVLFMDDSRIETGRVRSWISKMSGLRRSA